MKCTECQSPTPPSLFLNSLFSKPRIQVQTPKKSKQGCWMLAKLTNIKKDIKFILLSCLENIFQSLTRHTNKPVYTFFCRIWFHFLEVLYIPLFFICRVLSYPYKSQFHKLTKATKVYQFVSPLPLVAIAKYWPSNKFHQPYWPSHWSTCFNSSVTYNSLWFILFTRRHILNSQHINIEKWNSNE